MSVCQYVCMSICQYVNMSICQNVTFQLRYQNESCSKCHQEKVVKECEREGDSENLYAQPKSPLHHFQVNKILTSKWWISKTANIMKHTCKYYKLQLIIVFSPPITIVLFVFIGFKSIPQQNGYQFTTKLVSQGNTNIWWCSSFHLTCHGSH